MNDNGVMVFCFHAHHFEGSSNQSSMHGHPFAQFVMLLAKSDLFHSRSHLIIPDLDGIGSFYT